MPTNHYAVGAVPATGETALLRSGLVARVAYCLATSDNATDFVAIDPNTGDVCPAIIQNGQLYGLDNLDTTTAPGPTCLVSYDGKRYKLDSFATPFSVLSKGLTAPPVSPVIGDAYLLYSTPSGAWAGKLGYVAIFTSRDWEFLLPPIGFRVLVEDEGGGGGVSYYRDPSGNWQTGIGGAVLNADSVPLSAIIGLKASFMLRVQNQSTTAPPVSPSVGDSYIIGSPATGAWASNDLKVAICEATGTFTIYTPSAGDQVYDISLGTTVEWNGTSWLVARGAWVKASTPFVSPDSSGVAWVPTSAFYSYSDTSPPVSSHSRTTDLAAIGFAATRAGAYLRVTYRARVQWDEISTGTPSSVGADVGASVALFRDSETNAVAWISVNRAKGSGVFDDPNEVNVSFLIVANDTATHNYAISITSGAKDGGGPGVNDFYHRASLIAHRQYLIEQAP